MRCLQKRTNIYSILTVPREVHQAKPLSADFNIPLHTDKCPATVRSLQSPHTLHLKCKSWLVGFMQACENKKHKVMFYLKGPAWIFDSISSKLCRLWCFLWMQEEPTAPQCSTPYLQSPPRPHLRPLAGCGPSGTRGTDHRWGCGDGGPTTHMCRLSNT